MLNKRHQAILHFLHHYNLQNGFFPTIREIAAGVSISSTSVVNYHLEKLAREGYISRTAGRSRTIQLTAAAYLLLKKDLTAALPLAQLVPGQDEQPHLEIERLHAQIAYLKHKHRQQILALEQERDRLIDDLVRLQMRARY